MKPVKMRYEVKNRRNYEVSKELLKTKYRKEMWRNVVGVIKKLEGIISVSEAYLLGSFVTKKRRPADVDFIFLVKTDKNKNERWSLDMVISPDNDYGKLVLEDAEKWMKQKYGTKNYAIIKLK